MKSVDKNYKSDPSKGEGKLWDPNISLGRENKICIQTRWACPMLMSCNSKCKAVTEFVC
jgi:hypothetical protein